MDLKADMEPTKPSESTPSPSSENTSAPDSHTMATPSEQSGTATEAASASSPGQPQPVTAVVAVSKPLLALPSRPLTITEVVVCVTAILFWILFVAGGVAVSTKPYLDLISPPAPAKPDPATKSDSATKPPSPPEPVGWTKFVEAWFFIITCYTFTNVAILCCLSATIGAIGRSAGIEDIERKTASTDFRTLCISGVIRGFFIYIVIVSGILVLGDQKFDEITIAQYLRLVGVCSVLSFAVGYDPHVFVTLFQRVGQWTSSPKTP